MADTTTKKRDPKEGKEEREHKSQKRHRHEDANGKRKHKKRKASDAEDEGMWVEKSMDAMAEPAPASTLQREDWMLEPSAPTSSTQKTGRASIPVEEEGLTEGYGDVPQSSRTLGGGVDFFSSLGTERAKKPKPDRLNPDQLHISAKELNTELKRPTEPEPPVAAPKAITPGGPGSSWRMTRLRRAYETAEEEDRPIDEVAIERFGSLEAFEQAKEERRILNEREGRRGGRPPGKGKERDRSYVAGGRGERGIMYTDIAGSGASSRSSSFRQPGGMARSGAETPLARPQEGPSWQRYDSMHLPSEGGTPASHFHTPVPSVAPAPTLAPPPTTGRAMSPSSLNKMQAKVLRAKLMNDPNAETLEAQYEAELSKAHEAQAGGGREQVNVMPVVDARGRLYDIGIGKDDGPLPPGNRMPKEKVENPLEQSSTLEEMLRQERVGGADTQKKLDNQFAMSIMTDSGFEADLDYTDDNAEKLARQKMRSDAMKRQFAIQDYKRTQQALATCPFCYGEDDSLPKAPVVALGTRVYLSCTLQEELVPGHCLIVPIQHHLTMLEADDDVWDEVRNFMKSVMQMFADEDKGVVFYETILTLKSQKHTVIECVPVPWEEFDLLPGYFKESIMNSEAEWSQHKKLIDFSQRGGFRRMMVPNLPYFMVQFDHKGEKGYGHVIEGTAEAVDEDDPVDEGDKGGGDFPPYFAAEIIGNVLDLEPRRWHHPRRLGFGQNKERVAGFRKKYEKYDWTPMIGRS